MRRKRTKFKRPKKRFYRINSAIQADQLRVIDAQGAQIAVLPRQEALDRARQLQIDLVEIAPKAIPPVAQLIEFSKFKYLQDKKTQQEKRKQKNVDTKEIRLSPVIEEHDFNVRLSQAKEFLGDGNTLKVAIPFKGRMITRKQFGYDVLERFLQQLGDIKVVRPPKFEGRVLTAYAVTQKKKP